MFYKRFTYLNIGIKMKKITINNMIMYTEKKYLNISYLKFKEKKPTLVIDNIRIHSYDLKEYMNEYNLKEYWFNNIILYDGINIKIYDMELFKIIFEDKRIYSDTQTEYNKKFEVINEDGISYSFKKGINNKLVITFLGFSGYVKTQLYHPVNLLKRFEEYKEFNILSFQDDNFLCGSAYVYNDNFENIINKYLYKIKETIKLLNVKEEDLIFYGTSKGGYAALLYASFFPKSKFISLGPVLDFYKWNETYYAGKIINHYVNKFNLNYETINLINDEQIGYIAYASDDDSEQQYITSQRNVIVENFEGTHNNVINKLRIDHKYLLEKINVDTNS